jgi:hypothetical protein
VRAAHERVQFVKGALAMVDMLADDSDAKKHRNIRRTEIETRWMVLRFTGKQVNTSYSSEQIFVMLFLCNSLDSHPTIIFKPNGSF